LRGSIVVKSDAVTVGQYLASLPANRRAAISRVREVMLENLPEGYVERMNWGMISYEIPLSRYPQTYNKRPLMLAALASQKNYMAVYLLTIYGDPEAESWFQERYRASGKRLDMGKSCVRFRRLEDLPLDLVGEVIRKVSVDQYIERYERARARNMAGLRAT
jgi:hypothetical protein